MTVDGSQPEVAVEVVGGGDGGGHSQPLSQNLTLVLTSPRPDITWTITTARITGSIDVVLVSGALRNSTNDVYAYRHGSWNVNHSL